MLRVHLTAEDLGRIRFAGAPAPILEAALMLFEMRNRPRGPRGAVDWRGTVRSAFPSSARPLLNLAPCRDRVLFLDVLTADPEEAFSLVRNSTESVHAANYEIISRMSNHVPPWLLRYIEGDVKVMDAFDRALRSFHTACLAPHWSGVSARFHDDITQRMATLGHYGVVEMLSTLSPDVWLNGMTLESPYPRDRDIHLGGKGLVLIPSAFWTGYPLCTWDPQDPAQYVLVYPGRTGRERPVAEPDRDSLAALLGPTRAAVLRALGGRPFTTSGIARQVGISLPSASEHAATLRDAGLITSRRNGQAVHHDLTHLGRALLH